MLARLHDQPFDDPDWIYEIKWDGYRAIAEINGSDVKLYSRNGLSFEQAYPSMFSALAALGINAVLDGEIVALDEDGKPSFQLLQHATSEETQLCYYVFDLLEMNGHVITQEALIDRKELLKKLLPENDWIRYCDHVTEDGIAFFESLRQHKMEGMIAKKADSVYRENTRTTDWLKIKHILTDEAVIAGYTAPKGSRKYFGSLILGRYEHGQLQFIGHAGTGFDQVSLKELYEKMQPLVTSDNPFGEKVPVNGKTTWLLPELVCNIKFTEITKDGIRRHPVFMGLRIDKKATEVRGADAALPPKQKQMEETQKVGAHTVRLTNTNKIFWPDEGYTKGDVIAYYEAISAYILPYLKGRPLSLKRNPNGIDEQAFFHKDAAGDAPAWVHRQSIWSDSSEKDINYIVCDNKATLLYLANLGCIEMNPWHSRVKNLDNPDYLIIDLDPADGNTFDQVIETAKAVKQVLDAAGAIGFLKTSGSTGLHIYVPLKAKYDYDQAVAFAQIIATKTQELVPDFTSLERSLKKRGNNIYIDYLQNRAGQTIASPYSLRPKPGAPVSTPLEWKELKKGLTIERFNISSIFKRLEKKGDLFEDLLKRGINMAACLKKLGA
jgi:bifunctional non-homologous end joining protein LigD